MKNTTTLLTTTTTLALLLGASSLTLVGCATDAPGIKSNYVQQWSSVNGSVDEAVAAAEEVLGDYELKGVEGNATKLDGNVKGMMADGTEVAVDIRKMTEETSEVSVRVGTVGDPVLGTEIVQKIEAQLAV